MEHRPPQPTPTQLSPKWCGIGWEGGKDGDGEWKIVGSGERYTRMEKSGYGTAAWAGQGQGQGKARAA